MKQSTLLKIILSLSSLGYSHQLHAGEGNADAREQCRAEVSGRYLSFMNDLDLFKGNLNATTEANYAMKTRRKISARALALADAHNEAQKTPAADLDEKALGLRYELDHADDEIRNADVRIVTIKDQIAVTEQEFQVFKESIRIVFEIKTAKVVQTGGYPLTLQYRHPCSRFQALCTLPKQQSVGLLKLSSRLEDKTACVHYANMRADAP